MRQLFAVVVSILSACTGGAGVSSNAAAAKAMTHADYEGYLKALQTHDYEDLVRYYAPDVRMNDLDKDGIINMERGLATVWDWKMDVHQLVLDEKGAALLASMQGPFKQDVPEFFGASPKTGEQWRLDMTMFYELRDGKIAELHPGPTQFTRVP